MRCLFVVLALTATNALASPLCDKGPEDFFLFDTTPQAKDAGVDYPREVTAAFAKDRRALAKLFQVTGQLDGAGAQSHAEVLWSALQCWGDEAYASLLASQPVKVQVKVLEALDYETEESGGYSKWYPKTYSLRPRTDGASSEHLQPTGLASASTGG